MDNSINNISFRANVKSITKIKNKSAFLEVKKLFEDKTKNNTDDVLYISDAIFGCNKINLADSHKAILTDGINKQLTTMSATELAEKLAKIFETLKLHAKAYNKNNQLNSELNRAKALLNINSSIARACESEGKISVAQRYNILAERNKEKIEALKKEIENRLINFNKRIDELSKQYEELIELKFKI